MKAPEFLFFLPFFFTKSPSGRHNDVESGVSPSLVLVLTHNFLIRKQVITQLQMKMFVGCVYMEGK